MKKTEGICALDIESALQKYLGNSLLTEFRIDDNPVDFTCTVRCSHKLSTGQKNSMCRVKGYFVSKRGFLYKSKHVVLCKRIDVSETEWWKLVGWCSDGYGWRKDWDCIPSSDAVKELLADPLACICNTGSTVPGCVMFSFTPELVILIGGFTTGCCMFFKNDALTHDDMFASVEDAVSKEVLQCVSQRKALKDCDSKSLPLLSTLLLAEGSRATISLVYTVMGMFVVELKDPNRGFEWFKKNHPMTQGRMTTLLSPALNASKPHDVEENSIAEGMRAIMDAFVDACGGMSAASAKLYQLIPALITDDEGLDEVNSMMAKTSIGGKEKEEMN